MPRPCIVMRNKPEVEYPRHASGHYGAGRPNDYLPVYADIAYKIALLGGTDKDIGEALGVHWNTIGNWKKENPTFAQAIAQGRIPADAEVVHALHRKATGYDYEEEIAYFDRETGRVVKDTLQKHQPADTNAGRYWLTCRRGGMWVDKSRQEHTGANGTPLVPPILNIMPVKVISKD